MADAHRVNSFTLRLARPADAETVLRHRREMFRDMGFTDETALDMAVENSRAFIAGGLANGSYRGWLACDSSGTVIGGGGLIVHDWPSHPATPHQCRRAYVLNVYVDPAYRRRGVARAIMDAIVQHCRSDGFGTVWLHASEYGRPLYEQMGFEPTNEMKLTITGN